MTPEEANRRLSLTPSAGCRNSFSSCNDGKATSDDLHRKDWDGSSLRAGPGGSSPTVLPTRRGALLDVDEGSLLDADQQFHECKKTVALSLLRIQTLEPNQKCRNIVPRLVVQCDILDANLTEFELPIA